MGLSTVLGDPEIRHHVSALGWDRRTGRRDETGLMFRVRRHTVLPDRIQDAFIRRRGELGLLFRVELGDDPLQIV